MPLQPGTRVGPYEILAPLGAGGMGEVCRARDTKLDREVALKVLPEAFAADPQRMARFHREAQLLATLNHPNIATIYGFEEGAVVAGFSGPTTAIVMELVDGDTLAALIDRGLLPQDEALHIARQIAEALEYAHDRGVIHRDLKPANVKVTPEGTVKVLDFGLAKALGEGGDSGIEPGSSLSPTLSLAATYAGVILGTAAYMAPEQAKGKGVDRRADVWAFGVVLYEMLAGRRMFGGDSVAETLASVIKEPISVGALPTGTPAAVRGLVGRCLERDLRRRLQSIGEARILIEDVIAGVAPGEGDAAAVPVPRSHNVLPWAVASTAVLAAIAVSAWTWSRPGPVAATVTRFAITPPEGVRLTAVAPNAPQLAMSPDGRHVAFLADGSGREQTIWIRTLDSMEARRLDRTEGAMFPFWSPDSRHLAYFAGGKLMRIPLEGGVPLPICDAGAGEGGSWSARDGDGVIVFAASGVAPLQRVAARGGRPIPATTLAPGETGHSFPQFLPDGRRFLYLVRGEKAPAIYVQALESGEPAHVIDVQGRALYAPPGLLVFMRENTLLAQRWNVETLQLEGDSSVIAPDVRSGSGNGRNAFSVSANGVLVYRRAAGVGFSQVTWYSRDGRQAGRLLDPGDYGELRLSPDGSRLAIERGSGLQADLAVMDLTARVLQPLTSGDGREAEAAWSPDSRRVAYTRTGQGTRQILETLLGSGKHVPIKYRDLGVTWLDDWTPDGRHFVVHGDPGQLWLIPVSADGNGAGEPQLTLDEKYQVDQAQVSKDGKWVAYTSWESGRPAVNVASFPGFGERRQISAQGSVQPVWRSDGKELFFLGPPQTLMAVAVEDATTLKLGQARALFTTAINPSADSHYYAVTSDGQRFLIREPPGTTDLEKESLYVVTNWTSLLAP